MNKAVTESFLRKLQGLRSRLTGEVLHLSDEAFRSQSEVVAQSIETGEVGSDSHEQELTIQMLQSEENALSEINQAIDRIRKGTFGKCEECGKSIPRPRLNALPFARHCVECARLAEIRG